MPRFVRILSLAFAVLFVVGGCQLIGKKPDKPPIVLVVIDTLRADHVGVYGYQRPITPNLDRLAGRALRFANAQATASWTVPSMVSLFTGVYPWRHGIHSAAVEERKITTQPKLSDEFTTLAETLRDAGYETFGVSANGHIAPEYGMAQGFEHYKVFDFVNRAKVNQILERWMGRIRMTYRRGKPYFLYVHYFDPHHPYLAVEPYISQWRPNIENDPQLKKYLDAKEWVRLCNERYFLEHPDQMQMLVDLYDSEIAGVDASVGELLKALPGLDDAVVVVTADHGEAFGDHDNMMHGQDLHVETLHVPLLVKLPGDRHAGKAVQAPVSLVDVYPTLAGFAGATPPDYLDGVDFRSAVADQRLPRRALFAMTRRDKEYRWNSVTAGGYKWMQDRSHRREHLYDIRTDPGEKNDLAESDPATATAYRLLWRNRPNPQILFAPGTTGQQIDRELRDKLEGLGYL